MLLFLMLKTCLDESAKATTYEATEKVTAKASQMLNASEKVIDKTAA